MARATMSDLITRVRALTGAGTADWSDDQVQDVLDRHRLDLVREPLAADEEYAGGTLTWKTYRSGWGHLEQTNGGTAVFVVADSLGNARGTATWTADYQRGVVTFAADQRGTALYLTGRSYDVHAASAELLEAWASAVALDFDFATDGQSFRRSQKAEALRAQARLMRQRTGMRRTRIGTGR
jgi:hypothetical protein